MNAGRVALVATCVAVAALGVWFAVARWEDANRIATVASALGAVAAVGIAIWMALRGSGTGRSIRVSRTGNAVAGPGGRANTGVRAGGSADSVLVDDTGDADASGGGDANTGVG